MQFSFQQFLQKAKNHSLITSGLCLFSLCLLLSFWWVSDNVHYLTDTYEIKSPHQLRPHFIVGIFSVLSLAFFFRFLVILIHEKKRVAFKRYLIKEKLPIIALLSVFSIYGFLLFCLAPGLLNEDILYTYHMVRSGWWSGWYSPIHPFLYTFFLQIYPSMFFVTICNIFLLALSCAVATRFLLNNLAPKILLFIGLLLFLLSPPIVFMAMMPLRDSFFCSIFIISLILSASYFVSPSSLSSSRYKVIQLGVLIILWAILSVYRLDSILAALIFFLILGIKNFKKIKMIIISLATYMALFFTIGLLLPLILGSAWELRAEREYKLSLIIQPLSYLIKNGHFNSATAQNDKEHIEKIFTYKNLVKFYNPNNISIFWTDEWNKNSSIAERDLVFNTALKLFAENPEIFLASRLEMAREISGLQKNGEGIVYYNASKPKERKIQVTETPKFFMLLGEKILKKLETTKQYNGLTFSGRIIYWNLIIPNLLFLFSIFLLRITPKSAFFSSLLLSKEIIVLLSAPATFSFYYNSVFIGGIFIFLLLITEIKNYKKYYKH